jgi:hypothetical protein
MTIENKLLAAERHLLAATRSIQKAAVILTHIKGQTVGQTIDKAEYVEEPECQE